MTGRWIGVESTAPPGPTLPNAAPQHRSTAVPPTYADLDMGVAPGAVDTIRQRRQSNRWRSHLGLVVGLFVLAGVALIGYQAYERWAADRETETDYRAVCAIDERSLSFALEAFSGDIGGEATSLEELVKYGVIAEVPADWMLVPNPEDPGQTMLQPTPDGRCA